MDTHRMLLLDDHETTRRILRKIFKRQGWDVAEAGTVAEALALLDSNLVFEWLITDLQLPDGDGETVLKWVRQGGHKTHVMVCSATYDNARLEAVAGLGANIVLRKPIDFASVHQICGSAETRGPQD
jgi:CheY-like chemotaxis protein